jgi:putative ABC transport system permease protein
MLSFKDAIRQMWRDLRSQKLRTFLTVFGIIWGTVAVTLLLAFGRGLQRQMTINAAGIGDQICIAWPGLTSIPFEGLGKGRKIRLSEDDVETIRKEAPGLTAISSEYSQTLKMNYNTKTLAVDVSGVSPEFGDMRNLIPQEGAASSTRPTSRRSGASSSSATSSRRHLRQDVAGRKGGAPRGSPFLIVGVLQKKVQQSSYSGRDNGKAFIPGSTFRASPARSGWRT